jgi:predicted transcriptional regulator
MKLSKEEIEELERNMLDDYCSAILMLLWKKKEMRFNEIYRALKNKGVKLSKPTLSEHLKHLRKEKWIKRKVRGVQNVTYGIHDSIHRSSDEESWKWIEDKLKDMGVEFFEKSPEAMAGYALYTVLSRKMEELLLRIEIEPKIGNHSLSLGKSSSITFENSLVDDCKKDIAYRNAVLEEMKALQKIFDEGAEVCFARGKNRRVD